MLLRKKLIVANWKMAPDTLSEARTLFASEKKATFGLRHVQTVICSPALFLSTLDPNYPGTGRSSAKGGDERQATSFALGAQDCFHLKSGAHTGALSAEMLADSGAKFVLVGHSERRAEGESSVQVAMKVNAALDAGLIPILCVGEKERDEHGFFLKYLEEQLLESLGGVSKKRIAMLVLAYEPLWAISAQHERPATPDECEQMALYLRRLLSKKIGVKVAKELPVLYGGSVDSKNSEGFLRHGGVGGLLVGRASLNASQFAEILRIADGV